MLRPVDSSPDVLTHPRCGPRFEPRSSSQASNPVRARSLQPFRQLCVARSLQPAISANSLQAPAPTMPSAANWCLGHYAYDQSTRLTCDIPRQSTPTDERTSRASRYGRQRKFCLTGLCLRLPAEAVAIMKRHTQVQRPGWEGITAGPARQADAINRGPRLAKSARGGVSPRSVK